MGMALALAALVAAVYALLQGKKKKSDDLPGILGDLDPGSIPGLDDLVKAKVILRCLWCSGDAFEVERGGLAVGERGDMEPCGNCGRLVGFVSVDATGKRWCIS